MILQNILCQHYIKLTEASASSASM